MPLKSLINMFKRKNKNIQIEGRSPGLVVIRGDSCSEAREFESQHCYWMDIFSHLFVVKIVMFI